MPFGRILAHTGRSSIARLAATGFNYRKSGLRFSSTAPVTVVDGSFWRSLIPRPLRKENRQLKVKKKEWNPATFYIVIFLFIGSMSIQMIALRNSTERYMRQSSLRIARLREVVQRIQNGEEVDVEKVLGTGDAQQEAEWEEVLQAIERDDVSKKSEKQSKEKQPQAQESATSQASEPPVKTKTANFGNFF